MVTATDIDWILISLKRTPERLELFQLINAQVGLSYEILEAVDGLTVDPKKVSDSGLTVENLDWKPGALGGALSNLLCWERSVQTGRPVGIMEDDIFLRRDFMERYPAVLQDLPEDWDVIHFGFNTDSVFDLEIHPGTNARGNFSIWYPTLEECERFVANTAPVVPIRAHTSFGNCCYVVSPAGAKKLIEGVFPLSKRLVPIPGLNAVLRANSKDALMNEQYPKIAAYVCVPPLALPINDKQASTIGSF